LLSIVNNRSTAKLADFGISKQLEKDQSSFTNTGSCTMKWAAPELLDPLRKGERCKRSIDIFSLGTVYYFINTGTHLFGKNDKFVLNIIKGEYANLGETLPNQFSLQDLIQNMVYDKSESRINIKQVLGQEYNNFSM